MPLSYCHDISCGKGQMAGLEAEMGLDLGGKRNASLALVASIGPVSRLSEL
jgi:hypothetical protein